MTLVDDARAIADDLSHLRHRLHRRPEIGLRLQQTQATVLEELDGLGLEISTGADIGSVAGVLRGGPDRAAPPPGPNVDPGAVPTGEHVVLLRADMDALPVHEEVDVPFR